MTVKELIELLKTFPPEMECTYDYGLGLEVEVIDTTGKLTVDFH